MMDWIEQLTFSNMSRTFFSDSPMYMLINSGPLTLRKLREHSVATAFASNVYEIHITAHHRAIRPTA